VFTFFISYTIYVLYNQRKMIKILILTISFLIPGLAISQVDSIAVKTPEGITAKMLDFISFDKGEVKDWNEYRNLFLPGAHKLSINPDDGKPIYKQVRSMNIEEFVWQFNILGFISKKRACYKPSIIQIY